MKGQIQRPQIVGGILGLLIFSGAGFLAWVGFTTLQKSQDQLATLSEKVSKPELAAILVQEDGVNATLREAQKLGQGQKKFRGELEKTIGNWRKGFFEASGSGQPWSQNPGQWKDELVRINAEIARTSRETEEDRKVRLAEDFYLGLEEFRQRSPQSSELPLLALRLKVAERLTQTLFHAKEKAQEQYPTVCLLQKIAFVAREEKPGVPQASRGSAAGGEAIQRIPFEIQFRSSPEVLYAYVDLLRRDGWLFVVQDLRIQNELEQFPPRSEIRNRYEAQKKPANPKDAQEQDLILVLAGKESLLVDLRVEFVAWKEEPKTQDEKVSGQTSSATGAP